MSDLFAIEGKHVLVTGASSGFGRHFALFLAGRGARVTVAARRAEAIDKTVQTTHADKGQAQGVVMDVTSTGSIDVALAAAEQGFGPVDVLVNNAGVASTKAALEQAEADWDKVIDTNLKGVWLCSHSVGRRMAELKTGG
jgi:NAD(P)-dependent dehydrogenase (short-subunit alcohol dehydrogenase family)